MEPGNRSFVPVTCLSLFAFLGMNHCQEKPVITTTWPLPRIAIERFSAQSSQKLGRLGTPGSGRQRAKPASCAAALEAEGAPRKPRGRLKTPRLLHGIGDHRQAVILHIGVTWLEGRWDHNLKVW